VVGPPLQRQLLRLLKLRQRMSKLSLFSGKETKVTTIGIGHHPRGFTQCMALGENKERLG
jgi:hypothetical protein